MKHPVDCHVGLQIRRRRWMIRMTQQQLGDAVGIKFQQIQKYETGTNRVSASRLYEIARAMDVPISYFFEGVEGSVDGQSALVETPSAECETVEPDLFAGKEALELLRYYYRWPKDQRQRLFELTRSISNAA